ncbi:hypothetical protein A8C32_06945 [Flavivirga aquatica]|uniref:TonB-dependent receptor plug domain-containing protein n=1 Tax=Flavivirga aquatica TaxID=1849968 RepID=A0A1E5SJW2_9FLAO|nr:hypothetical protein A8C32_06945 [Flavivirga aquatica]
MVIYQNIEFKDCILSGYVREKGTLEVLPYATIYIDELKRGTITNDYGFFSIKVKKGTYKMTISYLGYQSVNKEVVISKNKTLVFELPPAYESLDDVTITANNTLLKVSKYSQMSTIQVTSSQIKDTPALLGENDVLKTMQLLPGIQSGTEGSAQVYIRGGSPDQNLIVLDEATVYNSNHLFGFLSVYNVDAIQSIKTYKGAFPASYGGRLSGITNITMKDGNKEKFSGNINLGILSSSFTLQGPLKQKHTSFLISGRRSFADLIASSFQQNNTNKTNLYFYDMNVKLHHILNEKNNLYLSSYFGQDSFKAELNDTNNIKEKLNWGNITATARWNHEYNNALFSNISLIYSRYNLDAGYERLSNNQRTIFNAHSGIDDFSLKTDFDYHLNLKHNLAFGGAATLHYFVPEQKHLSQENEINGKNKEELNSIESSAFLEDVISFTEKIKTTIGFRANYYKIKGFKELSLEPRLSIAYQFLNQYALKASYSKMNQYVHLLSNTGTGLSTDLWVSSTKNVLPQRSQQYALGLAKDFDNTGYSLEIEGYYKRMNNIITYKEGASFINIQDLQTGQNINWEDNITYGIGWAYGAECLLKKQRGALQGWFGYTLSWSQRQFDEINEGRKYFSRYDQRHNISLVGFYKPSNKVTYSASWIYRSGINFTVANLQGLSSHNNFPIREGGTTFDTFETNSFATNRNNIRGEATHRLDLGIQFHKITQRKHRRTWGFSIYNIYARKNPFFYYVNDGLSSVFGIGDSDSEVVTEKSLRRVSALVFIPSINYSYKF